MNKIFLVGKKIILLTVFLTLLLITTFWVYCKVSDNPYPKIKLIDFLIISFITTLILTIINQIFKSLLYKNSYSEKTKYLVGFLLAFIVIILFKVISGSMFWNDGLTIIEIIDTSLLGLAIVKTFQVNNVKTK